MGWLLLKPSFESFHKTRRVLGLGIQLVDVMITCSFLFTVLLEII